MEQLVNRRRVLYPKGKKEIDYSKQYLTTVALENGSITFTIPSQLPTSTLQSISYSRDGGKTWINKNNVNNQLVTIIVNNLVKDDSILWKGNGIATCIYNRRVISSRISSQCQFDVEGNIMSLLYGDDFSDNIEFPNGSTFTFSYLFLNCSSVINANNLILPATTLADNCYQSMFNGCTNLISVPALPATTLAAQCYSNMFQNCTSLTTVPALPVTTLADNCYWGMFYGCTSLVTAPELPATTLVHGCYGTMFQNCTSLTTAPELPATTSTDYCYWGMFQNCTSLVTAPELPATTLAAYCYSAMFYGCTSLVTAPELPATTLVTQCYELMFYDCSQLNYIKAMFTTTPNNIYTSNWVYGVSSSGTFVKNSAATWNVTGNNAIPSGWAVQTASE